MANLEPILKTWKKYLDEGDLHKWCESIVFLLEIFQSDYEFKAVIVDEANKFFLDRLADAEKSDVFFFLLGKIK